MRQINSQYDVIVIGGGASGMIAAGRAAESGARVLLIEKNKKLGEKLAISGGGRCNITNAEEDVRTLLKKYGDAEQFLYSLFARFGVPETFSFFEKRGLPLVVQARKRAFPQTERATDVVRVLRTYIERNKVAVRMGTPVVKITRGNDGITGVVAGKETFHAGAYILATGGISHPETGSTGDGLGWLTGVGHTVHTPTPTIVPLATKEAWSKLLAGVSLSFMKITFYADGKKTFSEKGKVLFTHFGLSGPLILNSAHRVADSIAGGARVTARIDAYPDTDHGALERRIVALFDKHKNKSLKNIIKDCTPEGTSKGMLALLKGHVDTEKKVHSITREERKYLVDILKALPLTVTGLMGFDRAVIADGGVALTEVDMRTMRSKKYPNLFITGDLLHITRPSGGFSLQLCWSTGYVAGEEAALTAKGRAQKESARP